MQVIYRTWKYVNKKKYCKELLSFPNEEENHGFSVRGEENLQEEVKAIENQVGE